MSSDRGASAHNLFSRFDSVDPADRNLLQQEYQSHLATARDLVRNYRGSREEYESVLAVLERFEQWMVNAFGIPANDNAARLTTDQEREVHAGFIRLEGVDQGENQSEDQRTIRNLLETAAENFQRWFDRVVNDNGIDEALRLLQVPVTRFDGVILPPGESTEVQSGSGNGFEKNDLEIPRLQQLIALLNRNGIFTDDIRVYTGDLLPNQMRSSTYYLVEIPSIQRSVLVCNQVGEATFVIKTQIDLALLLRLDKEMIQRRYPTHVDKIVYRNQQQWERSLFESVLGNNRLVQAGVNRVNSVPMNAEYFGDPANVRADLEAYALAQGRGGVDRLTTGDFRTVSVQCTSGEVVKFITYLSRAGVALGIARNSADSYSMCGAVLSRLKEMIGIEIKRFAPMDADYFSDPVKVDADLSLFAMSAGKSSVDQLTANRRVAVVCSNGEEVTLQTYLRRSDDVSTKTSPKAALTHLKRIIGIDVKEYAPMDADYFRDPVKVDADLSLFAISAGKSSVDQLNTDMRVAVVCSNGEEVRFQTYLLRVTVLLRCSSGDSEKVSPKAALTYLKQIVGIEVKEYEPMNADYFRDAQKVRADLLGFTAQVGKSSVEELTTTNVSMVTQCSNGEKIAFRVYLARAAKALDLANRDADSVRAFVLELLKSCIGIEKKQYPSMNADYFRDPVKVDADLSLFALACGLKTITELNARADFINVTCSNGETIPYNTYITRAGAALGLVANVKVSGNRKAILEHLKRIIGIEEPIAA